MHVYQPGLNALFLEDAGCVGSFGKHRAGSDNGDIISIVHDNTLSDLEGIVFVHEDGHLGAAQLDINRPDMCYGRMDKKSKELKAEVDRLLAEANKADADDDALYG
jgi:hypothetical protein